MWVVHHSPTPSSSSPTGNLTHRRPHPPDPLRLTQNSQSETHTRRKKWQRHHGGDGGDQTVSSPS
ncbi:hypothetical protein Hanom_Chr07g00669571 [Helianthus anomalus]